MKGGKWVNGLEPPTIYHCFFKKLNQREELCGVHKEKATGIARVKGVQRQFIISHIHDSHVKMQRIPRTPMKPNQIPIVCPSRCSSRVKGIIGERRPMAVDLRQLKECQIISSRFYRRQRYHYPPPGCLRLSRMREICGIEKRSSEIGLTQIHPAQIYSSQICSTQVGAYKACIPQMYCSQISSGEVCSAQVCLTQVGFFGFASVRVYPFGIALAEIRSSEVSSGEIRPTKIGTNQVSMTEIHSTEIQILKICHGQVCLREICHANIGTFQNGGTHIGTNEIHLAELCSHQTCIAKVCFAQVRSTQICSLKPG